MNGSLAARTGILDSIVYGHGRRNHTAELSGKLLLWFVVHLRRFLRCVASGKPEHIWRRSFQHTVRCFGHSEFDRAASRRNDGNSGTASDHNGRRLDRCESLIWSGPCASGDLSGVIPLPTVQRALSCDLSRRSGFANLPSHSAGTDSGGSRGFFDVGQRFGAVRSTKGDVRSELDSDHSNYGLHGLPDEHFQPWTLADHRRCATRNGLVIEAEMKMVSLTLRQHGAGRTEAQPKRKGTL